MMTLNTKQLFFIAVVIHACFIFIFKIEFNDNKIIEIVLSDMNFFQDEWNSNMIEFPGLNEKFTKKYHLFDDQIFEEIARAKFPIKYQFMSKKDNESFFSIKNKYNDNVNENIIFPSSNLSMEIKPYLENKTIFNHKYFSNSSFINDSQNQSNENTWSKISIWGPVVSSPIINELKQKIIHSLDGFETYSPVKVRFCIEIDGQIKRIILEKGAEQQKINDDLIYRLLRIDLNIQNTLKAPIWGVLRVAENP